MRDWSEFVDSSRFSRPHNTDRVVANLRYYATNYVIMASAITVLWTGLMGGWRGGLLLGMVAVGAHAFYHVQGIDNRLHNASTKLREKLDAKVDSAFRRVDSALNGK